MIRKILFLLTLIPSLLLAEVQKERRVYYLDCSYSMVKLNIWYPVCKNLITAINKVEDNTTELWVIPFAVDGVHHTTLTPIKAYADDEGKKKLEKAIMGISPSKSSMTYHSDPILDFYNNDRVAGGDCITYLFLMTDGKNEDKEPYNFEAELAKWTKYNNSQVYGFYVMLHQDAYNTKIENQIDTLPHFWNVHSANVNISLARVPENGVFNKRNEEWLELPITGKCSDFDIEAFFEDTNAPYKVTETTITGNTLRVRIEALDGVKLPAEKELTLRLRCKNENQLANKFHFWLTDHVKVTCLDKKERTLKITVK